MARGGYTFDEIKAMDDTELLFINHYQNLVEESRNNGLSKLLGVVWTKNDLIRSNRKGEGSGPAKDELFIPLSVAINPEVMNLVKKELGVGEGSTTVEGYTPAPNEKIVSMDEMSKEDFLKLMGKG